MIFQKQKQLSKEFVRKWLIENGFQGKQGQIIPEMSDEWITEISNRYIELYEKVTGKTFIKADYSHILTDIEHSVKNQLSKI